MRRQREAVLALLLLVASCHAHGFLEHLAKKVGDGIGDVKYHVDRNIGAVKDAIGNIIPKHHEKPNPEQESPHHGHNEEWHKQNPQVPYPYQGGAQYGHNEEWHRHHGYGGWNQGGHRWGQWGNNHKHDKDCGHDQTHDRQPEGYNPYGQGNLPQGGQQPQFGRRPVSPDQGNLYPVDPNGGVQGGQQQPQFGRRPDNPDPIGIVPGVNGQRPIIPTTPNTNGNPVIGWKPKENIPQVEIPTTEEVFQLDVRAGVPEEEQEQADEGVTVGYKYFMDVNNNCGSGKGIGGGRCRKVY